MLYIMFGEEVKFKISFSMLDIMFREVVALPHHKIQPATTAKSGLCPTDFITSSYGPFIDQERPAKALLKCTSIWKYFSHLHRFQSMKACWNFPHMHFFLAGKYFLEFVCFL
ncbi:hypothetical protein I3843_15G035000 [Carya illinoinensis]|nr:hypothetical protein I3843_15G035000 [Carya illinoinensis]